MKSPTSTNLIQYLVTRNNHQGFTLIELLVVITIIGILSAIALPSFLSCTPKRLPSSEAKTYIGSINRGQQLYFTESDKFSPTINQLGIGISEETRMYKYSTTITQNSAFNYGIAKLKYADENSLFDKKPVHSFVGGVFIVKDPKTKQLTSIAITCKNDIPGTIKPNNPSLKNGIPTCGEGTTDINKNTQR